MPSGYSFSLLNTVQRHSPWFQGIPARYHLHFFLWPRRKTWYAGPCQVLAALFVSRYFQDGETSSSFERRSLFRGEVRILTTFIHSDRALLLLRFNLLETWKHLPSWDGSEFVVWFSFVYVLLDSVSYGSWVDVEEKSPKYSSKWTLKVRNFH